MSFAGCNPQLFRGVDRPHPHGISWGDRASMLRNVFTGASVSEPLTLWIIKQLFDPIRADTHEVQQEVQRAHPWRPALQNALKGPIQVVDFRRCGPGRGFGVATLCALAHCASWP